MERVELRNILNEVAALEQLYERDWAFAQAMVELGAVEELQMAQSIIAEDDGLRTKFEHEGFDDIAYEITLREKWHSNLAEVDETLIQYPDIAEIAVGIGYKVALLAFSEYCSCDVEYACKLLNEVLLGFKSGKDEIEIECGGYAIGQWPRNHLGSVYTAMVIFTQRPCWVLRHLFLPGIQTSSDFKVATFKKV